MKNENYDFQQIEQTDLLVPDDCGVYVLLADHGLYCLRYRQLVVEHHELLVVGQEVTDCVLLEEVADVALHFVDDFPLLGKSSLFIVLEHLFDSVAGLVDGILATCV